MRPYRRTLALMALPDALELLLMLILGSVKQLTQDAVVQVDDFVGDGGTCPRVPAPREWRSAVAARIWPGRRVSSGPPSRAILSRRFW